ncbi:hypothetical protein Tco_0846873 [Tanacetum coccineum]
MFPGRHIAREKFYKKLFLYQVKGAVNKKVKRPNGERVPVLEVGVSVCKGRKYQAVSKLKSSSGKGVEFDDLLWNFRGNGAKSNDVKKE